MVQLAESFQGSLDSFQHDWLTTEGFPVMSISPCFYGFLIEKQLFWVFAFQTQVFMYILKGLTILSIVPFLHGKQEEEEEDREMIIFYNLSKF